MEIKKSFVIHIDSLDVIDSMSGDQTKELVLAFRDYHLGKELKLSGLMNAVFTQFKNQFDRDMEKYKNTIERNKNNGLKGGRPKTQSNPKKPTGLFENPIKPKKADNDNDNDNDNDKEINNKSIPLEFFPTTKSIKEKYKSLSFSKILIFKDFYRDFEFNKKYLFLAYRFWELWYSENPQNKTLKDAKLFLWYDTIRLIIETDKQPIERLIAVYKYFERCSEKDASFDPFWFNTIKSIGGLRHTNKSGEYRLDTIADVINAKFEKDEKFFEDFEETLKKIIK